MILKTFAAVATATVTLAFPTESQSADFQVYGVYRPIDLGVPGEAPAKDFYINMGSQHGLREGTVVEVSRKASTYDITTQKLFKDMVFSIARLKVIHVESNAAIARLDQMAPADKTPAISPRAVMVGDLIKPVN